MRLGLKRIERSIFALWNMFMQVVCIGLLQDLTTLRIVEIHGIDEHSHSQDQSTSHHVAKELREEAA